MLKVPYDMKHNNVFGPMLEVSQLLHFRTHQEKETKAKGAMERAKDPREVKTKERKVRVLTLEVKEKELPKRLELASHAINEATFRLIVYIVPKETSKERVPKEAKAQRKEVKERKVRKEIRKVANQRERKQLSFLRSNPNPKPVVSGPNQTSKTEVDCRSWLIFANRFSFAKAKTCMIHTCGWWIQAQAKL